MYWGDGNKLMNGRIAAVVIFLLLMYVKCLLLSLTFFLLHGTPTCTYTNIPLLSLYFSHTLPLPFFNLTAGCHFDCTTLGSTVIL